MEKLKKFLNEIKEGPLSTQQEEQLIPLLSEIWAEINIDCTTNLQYSKLNRIENAMWHPPKLRFDIERHGQTVRGSTRASFYAWEIDIEKAQAYIVGERYRQVAHSDRPFKSALIVQELRDIITSGCKDDRIEYKNVTKTLVKILVSKVLTASNKQTLASRRKKFRTEMRKQMAEIDWKEKRLYLYEKG